MITRFHIENFKSLVSFDIPPSGAELGKFTCLIGLNGSGKSTLLQAFDFTAQMAIGKVMEWLSQRDWRETDMLSNLGKRSPIVSFEVTFKNSSGDKVTWTARYNAYHARCTFEKIESNGQILLELETERLSLAGPDAVLKSNGEKLGLVYQGSILSILDLKEKHPLLTFVKENLRQMKSLELLSPQLLRKRAFAAKDIGVGGEKFSAFLYRLSQEDKTTALLAEVKKFYPHLENWTVKSLRAGWKDLQVSEHYEGSHKVPAVHINDGMLRIMAILSQAHTTHTFLLFDEIENGINPELVEKLVNFLINCGKQVVVTTHSPMILNYIPDEIAKKSVFMLYKTRQGETRAKRFFDLEGMEKKLKFLGPGEVFVDTNLSELAEELQGTQPPQLPSLKEQ